MHIFKVWIGTWKFAGLLALIVLYPLLSVWYSFKYRGRGWKVFAACAAIGMFGVSMVVIPAAVALATGSVPELIHRTTTPPLDVENYASLAWLVGLLVQTAAKRSLDAERSAPNRYAYVRRIR